MNVKHIVAVLLLTVPGLAGAQINKCIDAKGTVVAYGSECPAGTRSEATNIKNQPAATPAAPAQKSLSERDAEFRKRQVERQESAAAEQKKAAESAERKRACDDARAYVKTLERGRVTRTDPKTGEREFLTDKDISSEMARAQKAVAEHCK